jgi:hypothetical protein
MEWIIYAARIASFVAVGLVQAWLLWLLLRGRSVDRVDR